MYKSTFLAIAFLLILDSSTSNAQVLWGRLKQKAEEIGERAIDKSVDDILSGKKRQRRESRKAEAETPEVVPVPNEVVVVSDSKKSIPEPYPVGNTMIRTDTIFTGIDTVYHFNTATITPKEFVSYALTLKGTPYVYASTDPAYGLDCSGFITHAFNHFNISVPRRAFDFKNAEKKVLVKEAKPGDLILFTGADYQKKTPGHMGIVIGRKGQDIEFVHAIAGKTNAVTTSLLSNTYFKSRVLEVVRVF